MNRKVISLRAIWTLTASGSPVALAAPDWSKVPKTDIHDAHPAVTPVEWLPAKGGEHGGVDITPGKAARFGIHADIPAGRFHHVSFECKLGTGTGSDVKALIQ
jgi:hypothetical protein